MIGKDVDTQSEIVNRHRALRDGILLLDPRHGVTFDLPHPEGPRRTLIIASLPRTGSSWLCRTLESSGEIGRPKEILNPVAVRDWEVRLGSPASRLRHLPLRGPGLALVGRSCWSDHRLRDHFERIRRRRSARSGWFGFKVHDHHRKRWFDDAGRDLRAWEPDARWIIARRRDQRAQAVSWVRASQTGRWASHQTPIGPEWYSSAALDRALRQIREGERRWFEFLRGADPLVIEYEDLIDDLEAQLLRVYRHLEIEVPPHPVPQSLRRQADAVTEDWLARWRTR